MYLAENAREDSMKIPLGKESGWTIFHTLELKYVERKIRKAATRGKKEILIKHIGELVRIQLKKNGYKLFLRRDRYWLIDWD